MRLNDKQVGGLLAATRKATKRTQSQIASLLGYDNRNFISMIEGGKSSLPPLRVFDFTRHYGLSSTIARGILLTRYPEHLAFLQSRKRKSLSETEAETTLRELAEALKLHDVEFAEHSLDDLLCLWEQFLKVPKIPSEAIMRPFLHFPSGTREYQVEDWFRSQFEKLSQDELGRLIVMLSRQETRLEYGEALKKRFLFFPEKTNRHQIVEWIERTKEQK